MSCNLEAVGTQHTLPDWQRELPELLTIAAKLLVGSHEDRKGTSDTITHSQEGGRCNRVAVWPYKVKR